MQKLILFDIDGTLIQSKRVGSKAMNRAMERFMGSSDAMRQIKMGGLCDWNIWRQALAIEGYTPDEVDAQLPELLQLYVTELAWVLASNEHPTPEAHVGIRPLLDALHAREDVLLGLLTGNTEAGAWLKIGAADLDHYFRFGAFGNESVERDGLPPIAVERAKIFAHGHDFKGKDIIIIGDTISDIECGQALGVCAIGVGTGSHEIEALWEAGADHVFASFAEHEEVLEMLVGMTANRLD